jgi:DNA-binding NarL/FixJ family response regulator
LRRVAVSAPDAARAGRIERALAAAGHELAGTCLGLAELTDDFSLLDADLAVAVADPMQDGALLGQFRHRLPAVPLIAVVPSLRGAESNRLLAVEIDGLVLEDELERVLAAAIASALADQLCVPSGAVSVLAGPVFSHREKQVLTLLLSGLSNSEIASRLFLSESTVKSHLSSSFRKLGVSSRAEVVRRARSADSALAVALRPDRSPGTPRPVLA